MVSPVASANPMLLSDEEFEKYRYKIDPPADTAAFAILNFFDHGQVYQILAGLEKNTDKVSFEIIDKLSYETKGDPAQVEFIKNFMKGKIDEYFNDRRHFQFTPEEKECLTQAAIFFNLHMTECTLALAVRSLLKQYAAFKSTNVLTYTQLLPKYPYRRIISTMQFVMDVMDVKAFEPEGYGIVAIQKLRLVHALIRNRIERNTLEKKEGQMWNQEWGLPINQQDMIFAVHTFSLEVLHGLIASGEKVSNEEIQNYYYAWHLIGKALGVKDELNPSEYYIGWQVQNRIYKKEFVNPNPNGPPLAEPLINFMVEVLPLAKRKGVYGLVKLFNDKKDYDPVFKDILHLDLSQSSKFYTTMYNAQDNFRHFLVRAKYFFLPRAKRSDYFKDLAKNEHKFFESIIGVAKT
ncbi:MAG TPA: oxygenase MpaB family protein, partial [Saprospiraceae bacterium]|nr:oxygenase MpaB family protein [Saprospiraceae bacterium]